MVRIYKHVTLTLALIVAGAIGACGGSSTPNPDTAADKKDDQTATTGGTDAAKPDGAGTDAAKPDGAKPDATAEKQPDAPPAAKGKPSTPIRESKMLADVKKIGLDINKLPEFDKMPLAQKKKLMPLFQKAMGYGDCWGCHVKDDYKAETRHLKITRGMWKHFVVAVRDEKGGAVFCDTCHDGNEKNLDRSDRKAVEKFMEDEYEHKLTRADKKDMECSTCHSDTMEMKIIEKVWGIAAK
ncbi:MAG: hypothetical protein IPM54_00775 [Polyangiaceae bacterium]|nr:hypothetical protein [Polyangiaceae bacterium]